jgi:hypothetical protein
MPLDFGGAAMTRKSLVTIGIAVWPVVMGLAISAQDKYAAKACHARVKTRDYVFTEYGKR